jgi:hypothetical protein
MIEHRLIEQMLNAIQRPLEHAEKTRAIDSYFVDTAVDFIRVYADRCQRQSSLSPFRRNEMSRYRRFYLSSSSFTVTDLGGGPKMPAFRFSFSR